MIWHPFAERFPLLEDQQYEELKSSIAATNGIDGNPIEYRVLEDGTEQYLDGRNRLRACEELGINADFFEVTVADEDVIAFIVRKNITRRHLDAESRKILVLDLRADGQSTRQIAETLGVSQSVVVKDLDHAPGEYKNSPGPSEDENSAKWPENWLPVCAYIKEHPEASGNEVARALDISPHVVAKVKKRMAEEAEAKPADKTSVPAVPKVVGKDNKVYAAKKAPLLCSKCQRVGAVKDCPQCKAVRDAAKAERQKPKTLAEAVSEENDKEEEDVELSIEDQIKLKNSSIESFCRRLMKFAEEECPQDEWLTDLGRRDTAMQKIGNACSTLRGAKCFAACPLCEGQACDRCHKTGRVPKLNHDQMVK